MYLKYCPSLTSVIFFVINIFFFFHTQHHNTISIQNKQNNKRILPIPKVQSQGRERGRKTKQKKKTHVIPWPLFISDIKNQILSTSIRIFCLSSITFCSQSVWRSVGIFYFLSSYAGLDCTICWSAICFINI